jgi:uncharacterized protein (TIGR00730 family)
VSHTPPLRESPTETSSSLAPSPWSLCVYCGSRHGTQPAYTEAARQTGVLLAASGGRLVYGGGRVGLMGEVADAALSGGASVIGVIPDALMRREVGHPGVQQLHVVQTMHERKMMMAEMSDAFLALPGGIGTMEELFEMWSWQQLGYHAKPVGLLNLNGFYDPLVAWCDLAHRDGFLSDEQHAALWVDADLGRLVTRLQAAAKPAQRSADYSRT